MSNFGYLKNKAKYKSFAEELIQAEELYGYNTKICVRQCRAALEATVRWVYQKERMNSNEMTLGQLVHNADFIHLLDYKIWSLLPGFVTATNEVVHIQKEADKEDALKSLRILFKFVQWIEANYALFYVERRFYKSKIGVPDNKEEELRKIVICDRTILEKNFYHNAYQNEHKNTICLEKALDPKVIDNTVANFIIRDITLKNREWPETEEEIAVDATEVEVYEEEIDSEELFSLAEQYRKGNGKPINYKLALENYQEAAIAGHPKAQYNLARFYAEGIVVEMDKAVAMNWYGEAAKNGVADAQYILAEHLQALDKKAEANKWYHEAAEQGHASSQYKLGIAEEDKRIAFTWFEQAANQNLPEAEYELGKCYAEGIGIEKNQYKAVFWYRKSAEQNYAPAQCELGLCYYKGNGVGRDTQEAVKWFRESTEYGNAEAQYNLGNCYYNGQGVVQSYEEALKWYTKAIEQGYKYAISNKKECEEKLAEEHRKNSVAKYRKEAEQGDALSQYRLGNCYYNGEGVSKNFYEAVKWYTKAAEQRHIEARYRLGNCYYSGEGIYQSYKEAAKWYGLAAEQGHKAAIIYKKKCEQILAKIHKENNTVPQSVPLEVSKKNKCYAEYIKAAERGDVTAQNNLGDCYYDGKGVEKSYIEAVKWYTKAAERGNATAQYNLGDCYYDGKGIEKSYTEAVKWYTKAANQGHAEARYKLGLFYKNGEGVKQSYEEAWYWYKKAAEQRIIDAQESLADCYYNGKGVVRSYEEALKWYKVSKGQGNTHVNEKITECEKLIANHEKYLEERRQKELKKQEYADKPFISKIFDIFK